jgi:hypothetical protein
MSAKPSLKAVSGGLVVVWWASFGFISVCATRGSVFGVFMADSCAILSRNEASDGSFGVDKTWSMVDCAPDSGVSSRSRRDPSCICVKGVFRMADRCARQHEFVSVGWMR